MRDLVLILQQIFCLRKSKVEWSLERLIAEKFESESISGCAFDFDVNWLGVLTSSGEVLTRFLRGSYEVTMRFFRNHYEVLTKFLTFTENFSASDFGILPTCPSLQNLKFFMMLLISSGSMVSLGILNGEKPDVHSENFWDSSFRKSLSSSAAWRTRHRLLPILKTS